MTKTSADKQRTRRQQLNEAAVINNKASIVMEEPNTMDATIVIKRINSKDSRMVLRAGEKGRGKELHEVRFWHDSARSVEAAENSIRDFADRKGYRIV